MKIAAEALLALLKVHVLRAVAESECGQNRRSVYQFTGAEC